MVGLGSQSRPQPQNPTANDKDNKDKHNLVLTKGKLVEVSSDEDGFKGAWYEATIAETPAKSSAKKKKKVLVQYKTLLKEDLSLLVEPVDPGFIRPLPPETSERVFEVNDIVDAGYRDGWWTGVVRKVLDGCRYTVYFDNPPDIIDFDGKDLRNHFEWVYGNWVKSEKQNTTGSVFSSGTGVEVNIDKENVRDAWFPAVVVKENEDSTFLVKCQSPGNTDETGTKVVVDSHHIRPIPPHYADRDFELLEKVDTPFCSGWRAGLITKLLAERMYNVFFKQGNEQKEFNFSEIRPYAEWANGKWICKSKEVLIDPNNEIQLDSVQNSAGQPKLKLVTDGAANDKGEEKAGNADGKVEEKAGAADGKGEQKEHAADGKAEQKKRAADGKAEQKERAADGKDEKKAPSSSSTGEKTLLEQSTHSNEKSSSHVLPPTKKVKLATPNSTDVPSQTLKKLAEEGPLNATTSVTPSPLAKTPVETPIEATLRRMTSTRTYGKRSRGKKTTGSDQPATQTETLDGVKGPPAQIETPVGVKGPPAQIETPVGVKGPPAQIETPVGVKGTVASGASKTLIRIKELPEAEKNKKQEALAVHRQKLELVTKKGRFNKSLLPLSSSLIAVTGGDATTHVNQSEDKRKEAEVPVILGLGARDGAFYSVRKRKSTVDPKKNLNGPSGGKIKGGLDQQTPGGGSSQRRKRGRPRRLVVAEPPETTAEENDGIKDVVNGSAVAVRDQTINQVKLPVQKMVKCTGSGVELKERATEVYEIACTTNKAVVDDDQPLSMWIGGMHSSANAEDLQLSSARPEKRRNLDCENALSVNEVSRDGTPDGNHCLPFVKKSPVWETIESMEVFRITPQNPHFRPLADCKEEYREGSAIGVMVTFASLFEKITSLTFDDSRSVLDSVLDSLADLASHGFDISLPQDRVFQLLELSTNHDKEKLLRESKEAEEQIKSHSDERKKLDANTSVIEKKIRELQEELAAAKSKKVFVDHEISRLQTRMASVNVELNDARRRFENVASAPWQNSLCA
ncbi:Agenet domain-containing protein [Euphorbia peplus]|nr:Agenet domain-containing protein [Euphorbia peplus]